MDTEKPKTDSEERLASKRLTFGRALNISVEFAFIILIPLLGFVFLGKYLDRRYETGYFVIIGIVLALAVSTIWFIKVIKKLAQEIKNL